MTHSNGQRGNGQPPVSRAEVRAAVHRIAQLVSVAQTNVACGRFDQLDVDLDDIHRQCTVAQKKRKAMVKADA